MTIFELEPKIGYVFPPRQQFFMHHWPMENPWSETFAKRCVSLFSVRPRQTDKFDQALFHIGVKGIPPQPQHG
jgi:hypothetical protein